MQALISNKQELRFKRNENTAVHNRFLYSFDISRRPVDRVRHNIVMYIRKHYS